MKKFLLIFATALMLTACGQKDDNKKEQPEKKEVFIPQGVPVAPMQQIQVPEKGGVDPTALGDPNAPVLRLEEGQPLDFSQLMGGRKSFQDQVIEHLDTIVAQAKEGKAEYEYLYGLCYENGWGVEQNPKQAFSWYSKSAEQDYAAACNSLGNLYRMGSGVATNANKALEWYRKGAKGGDGQAMLNLGNCYFYGMGVEKDEKTAVKWWTDAAEAGNAFAMSQMGDCYYYGIGVEKDLEKAIEYYQPAADKNISNAQFRLGILYYTGNGVQQDRTYAKLLMQKARDGGMPEAKEFLDRSF